jgi:hypothetical protein
MNINILAAIVVVLICVIALNWAISSAYTGMGFFIYALVNGLLIAVVILSVILAYRSKK